MSGPQRGIDLFLEALELAGVEYLFGNPGSTELPLNDALAAQNRIRYILGLQEIPVVAAADGYAMASGRLSVVNLHISCGLGNAMGMLYNAHREGTPLLITAGQQDRRLIQEEPILWGDLTAVAKPWTKYAAEVSRIEDLPVMLRRAIQAALTPPTGPVFLALPVDLQLEPLPPGVQAERVNLSDPHVHPPREAVQAAAELLAGAKRPGVLVGSRVQEMGAVDSLVALAEQLGAQVISESGTTHGRLAFPCNHPLYGQGLPLWSPEVRNRLAEFDVLLLVGLDVLRQYIHHEPGRAIPEHIRLVQLDFDPWQLGKNYAVECGLIGHARTGLEDLLAGVRQRQTPEESQQAAARVAAYAKAAEAARKSFEREIETQAAARPLAPAVLMRAVARALPHDAAVIEEAVTTTNTTLERLGALGNTSGYFGHRGWSLGWGLGCTLGVKLAWPGRPVLGILGEGAVMYGIQGLWTAARYNIGAKFVICNNGQYGILKACSHVYGLPEARRGRYESLDLNHPEIDIVAIARALGVETHRITEPEELTERLRESWPQDSPLLLDVPIARGPERLEYGDS